MESLKVTMIAIENDIDIEKLELTEGSHALAYEIDLEVENVKFLEDLFCHFLKDKFPISMKVQATVESMTDEMDEAMNKFSEKISKFVPESGELAATVLRGMVVDNCDCGNEGGICKQKVC